MRYKAILLDFYGTLVSEDDHVIGEMLRDMLAAAPAATDKRSLGRAWLSHFRELCAASHGERFRTQRDIEIASLEAVLTEYQIPLSAQELAARQFVYWSAPRIFDDAIAFVDACPLPICVVSNIDRSDLENAIRHAGWRFDHVLSSEDVRSYKPRPELFQRALALLGLAPHEVLHIGDSWSNDVVGAQQQGIAVAWVNRAGRTPPPEATPPDYTLTSLTELAALLDEHHQEPR